MSRAIDCLIDPACCAASDRRRRFEVNDAVGLLLKAWQSLSRWQAQARQRRDLCRLADSPELLRDTGLSRDEVRRAAHRPFWRD